MTDKLVERLRVLCDAYGISIAGDNALVEVVRFIEGEMADAERQGEKRGYALGRDFGEAEGRLLGLTKAMVELQPLIEKEAAERARAETLAAAIEVAETHSDVISRLRHLQPFFAALEAIKLVVAELVREACAFEAEHQDRYGTTHLDIAAKIRALDLTELSK